MELRIFDYANKVSTIKTQDKEIKQIEVTILTGDEIITVWYEDGTCEKFDSNFSRCQDFFDGSYVVTKNKLHKWNEFEPTDAYMRQFAFENSHKGRKEKNKMKELTTKQEEVLERWNWEYHYYDDGTVDVKKRTPAGEDFFFNVPVDDFTKEVSEYYRSFDPEEHCEMWITARNCGVSRVPSIFELVEDAKSIKDMLCSLSEALELSEDEDKKEYVLLEVIEREISQPAFFDNLSDAQMTMCRRFAQSLGVPEGDVWDSFLENDSYTAEDNDCCHLERMSGYAERYGQNFDWKIFEVSE